MKIKFNWGVGIAIVIVIFFITVIVRIIISSTISVDLITPDYYHNELKYEQQIQKEKNTILLTDKIISVKENNKIVLKYPDFFKNKKVTGNILFYNPAKINKDLSFEINVDDSLNQSFDISQFTESRYIIKIDWQADSIFYYQEIDLNF